MEQGYDAMPEPSEQGAMPEFARMIETLGRELNSLEERLQPILRPAEMSEVVSELRSAAPTPDIRIRLGELREIRARIAELSSRVDL